MSPAPTARNFAPTIFSKRPDRDGLRKKDLEAAMHRLMGERRVLVEEIGPPSKRSTRLCLP